MPDLEELRRVLHAREALAPEPDGIAAAARKRGVRIRRNRVAGAVAGSAVAVIAAVALGASVLAGPDAAPEPGGGPASSATPTGPVRGGWPAVPSYTAPAVPGAAGVPGPTQGPTAPVSSRAIDPIVPYRVTLPDGWRETEWWYEEGSFRGTYAGPDSTVQMAVIDVLDPATRPASLLRPSGDPATGSPGPDGTLAWLADPRHFVRVQLQGEPPAEVLRGIAGTLSVTERPMIAPFQLDHLPAGLHLSGARVRFATPQTDLAGETPWGVTLTFDYGSGPTRTSHDLQIGISDDLGAAPNAPIENPTTVAGRTASILRIPEERATLVQVYGVNGSSPYFVIGDSARDRITSAEVARILDGLSFVARPQDTGTWLPLQLP